MRQLWQDWSEETGQVTLYTTDISMELLTRLITGNRTSYSLYHWYIHGCTQHGMTKGLVSNCNCCAIRNFPLGTHLSLAVEAQVSTSAKDIGACKRSVDSIDSSQFLIGISPKTLRHYKFVPECSHIVLGAVWSKDRIWERKIVFVHLELLDNAFQITFIETTCSSFFYFSFSSSIG